MLRAEDDNEFSNEFMKSEMNRHQRFWSPVNRNEISYSPVTSGSIRYPRLRLHFIGTQLDELTCCTGPTPTEETILYSIYNTHPYLAGWRSRYPLNFAMSYQDRYYDQIRDAIESVRDYWTPL